MPEHIPNMKTTYSTFLLFVCALISLSACGPDSDVELANLNGDVKKVTETLGIPVQSASEEWEQGASTFSYTSYYSKEGKLIKTEHVDSTGQLLDSSKFDHKDGRLATSWHYNAEGELQSYTELDYIDTESRNLKTYDRDGNLLDRASEIMDGNMKLERNMRLYMPGIGMSSMRRVSSYDDNEFLISNRNYEDGALVSQDSTVYDKMDELGNYTRMLFYSTLDTIILREIIILDIEYYD